MNNRATADFAEQVSAAFDWWREAGVDCDFHEEPANWLVREEQPDPDGPAEPLPVFTAGNEEPREAEAETSIDHAAMPDSLSAFQDWWLQEPTLDNGRVTGRVPPRGYAGAELMVIVPEPESADSDTLLSGPEGRLLSAMLEAMGIAQDAAYLASALPRHTPMADWVRLAAMGLDAVTSHHVKLVRPKRLIVLGRNILPLIHHDPAQEGDLLRQFNHEGLTVPLFPARSLAALLERPRWKAAFWREWLDWTGKPS